MKIVPEMGDGAMPKQRFMASAVLTRLQSAATLSRVHEQVVSRSTIPSGHDASVVPAAMEFGKNQTLGAPVR